MSSLSSYIPYVPNTNYNFGTCTSTTPEMRVMTALVYLNSFTGQRFDPASLANVRFPAPNQTFEYSSVQLRTFQIANTINNISDDAATVQGGLQNNVFTFSVITGTTGGPYVIDIPPSFYDGPTLATMIQEQMITAASASSGDFVVTFDPIACKFTFISTIGNLSFDFSGLTSPWLEFGFGQTGGYTGDQVTSPYVAHLEGTSSIFIRVSEFGSGNAVNFDGSSWSFVVPVDKASSFLQGFSYQYSGSNHLLDLARISRLSILTIFLNYERAGILYPLVMDANSSYSLIFQFQGLRV